jgi:hypothetical protein
MRNADAIEPAAMLAAQFHQGHIYWPNTHMRFPCLEGEGWEGGVRVADNTKGVLI